MVYAIFKAAGFQYRAEPGDVLRLPTLDAEEGATVTFDEVLFGSADGEPLVGKPVVAGAVVRAEVLGHGRADKIVVYRFKRRKNYRRKTGHRQDFTEVKVSEIDFGGGRKVSLGAPKKAAKTAKKTTSKKTAKAAASRSTKKTPAAAAKKKSAPKAKKKTPGKKKES